MIARHYTVIAFDRWFRDGHFPDAQTFARDVRAAIELARADCPTITPEDVRWVVDNWFGPPGLLKS